MRTLTAAQTKVLQNPTGYGVHSRFSVNSGGSWVDLTNLAGYDWLESWSYRYGVDDQVAALDCKIFRENYKLSLAPLVGSSKFNQGAPTIQVNSEVKMEVACMPSGTSPSAGDWATLFHGYVVNIDWSSDPFTITCHDLGCRLQRRFIKKERQYSNSTGVAVETIMQSILDDNMGGDVAQTSWPYAVGDSVRATGYGFLCTQAGTSGSSPPSWNTTTGATTLDGSVVWQCTGPTVTLQVPASPLWVIRGPWWQAKKPVYDAINDLAAQTGWALRYLWNVSVGDFALTFFEPGRAKTTPDWTIGASTYYDVKKLAQDLTGVRNVIRVVYGNIASTDNLGNPLRNSVVQINAASVAKYDEQYMEIGEATTSRINDTTQATNLAQRALLDLQEPLAEHEITTSFFWPVELGDLWQFTANGVHYDSNQKYAVISIQHDVSQTSQRTTVLTRGAPVARYREWIQRGARPGLSLAAPLVGPQPVTSVAATPVKGGAAITFAPPTTLTSKDYAASELHVSTSSGFAPSASTIKAQTGVANRFEVTDLTPGTTYYGQVIAKDSKGNQASASGQFSFVAGYTRPTDLQPQIDWGANPLNGDFEAASDGSTPDWWTVISGSASLVSTSFSGARAWSLAFASAVGAALMPVRPGASYAAGVWAAYPGTGSTPSIAIKAEWYDKTKTLLSTSTLTAANSISNTAFTETVSPAAAAPSNASYVRLRIDNTNPVYIDKAWLIEQPYPHIVGGTSEPAFANSWSNLGSGNFNAQFSIDRGGVVRLAGAIHNGTIGSAAFILPSGYRPVSNYIVAVASSTSTGWGSGLVGYLLVDPSGNVTPLVGNNFEFHLDGATFQAGA